MRFAADTIRLTPLDSHRHLIDRGPVVLSDGLDVDIALGRRTLREATRGGVRMPEGQPDEWQTVNVLITGFRAKRTMRCVELVDVLKAATRTAHGALEAWSSSEVLVMPWVSYSSQGAGITHDGVEFLKFSGALYDRDWGHRLPSREVDGRERLFVPPLTPRLGAVWAVGPAPEPPPDATTPEECRAMVAADPYRR